MWGCTFNKRQKACGYKLGFCVDNIRGAAAASI